MSFTATECDDRDVHPGFASAPPPSRGWPWWAWTLLAGGIALILLTVVAAAVIVAYSTRQPRLSGPTSTPVRDGQFEFTATRPDCSRAAIDDRKPRGRWCTVVLKVRNTGRRPQSFAIGHQHGEDADRARYEPDAAASKTLSRNLPTRDVNPGIEFTCVLAFDVGREAVLTTLVVHDSWLSGGARIDLP